MTVRGVAPLDRETAQSALDELFAPAGKYNSSEDYLELMRFVGRFRFYSPFNAMLIHTQMPGAQFACTARKWQRDYGREIKINARPIVILQPMGPVLFLFDVSDTEALPNGRPLPRRVEDPYRVRNGQIGGQMARTIDNAKRDGVRVSERSEGSQSAGSIQWAAAGQHLEFMIAKSPAPKSTQVSLWFELLLNSVLSAESRYATLVHELAHLYCGHLGTPNARWWPDRQNLSETVREFEAESVSYLVCTRLGIDTASDEYLAAIMSEEVLPLLAHQPRSGHEVCLAARTNGASELGDAKGGEVASQRRPQLDGIQRFAGPQPRLRYYVPAPNPGYWPNSAIPFSKLGHSWSPKENGGSADLRNAFPGNFGLSVSLGPFVLATRQFKTGHFHADVNGGGGSQTYF